MDIVIFRKLHSISFGAAGLMTAASTVRRLTAACGLVLLTQVLARTAWITIVAMSSQPTTVTVSTASQSAASPNFSYHNPKEKSGHVPVFLFIL